MELSEKATKSVTTVQDCVSTFVGVKPLDICQLKTADERRRKAYSGLEGEL